ncbi:MAG: thiamine-phosphate kinase [Cyclobacteriaceae bacterium]|jgi:thiamine-monophosphate kinase|nr:thiamine-phosphate kinase [Cyclobacteriaceae bacterium]
MSANRKEIKDLGEFGLIDHLTQSFSLNQTSSVLGVGDDAAVIDIGEEYLLLSTDMLVEGIHFDLGYTPLHHLGYKSVAVNVSDIAAMNGTPQQITVSIAISNRFSVEALEQLYQGMKAACDNYNIDLVGGDTTSSTSGLIISISVVGRVAKNKLVKRKGAQANDIICVSGDLGAAYMGLQILEREKAVFLSNPEMQPNLEVYDYLVGRILKPEARTDIVFDLAEKELLPTAMMDISDGLASELFHLCKQNNLGFRIYEDKIPLDNQTYETAIEFILDPITCALNGGEDYELLFSIPQSEFEKVKMHADIHMIGYFHADVKERIMVTKQGNITPIQAQGWTHF